MTTEQFNSDPDHVPVTKFRPEIVLGFIVFHRRFIIGTALLLGVAYLLVRLNNPDLLSDSTKESVTDSISPSRLPERVVASPSIESKAQVPVPAPLNLQPPAPVNLDEEFNELLATDGVWANKSYSLQAEMLQNRAEKLRSLLANRNLTSRHRIYCEHNYVSIVAMLSEVSENIETTISKLDEMAAEIDKLHSQGENKDLAGKASSVFVRNLVSRFLKNRSDENFESLKNALLARQDTIKNSEAASIFITAALVKAIVTADDDSRLRELAIEHLTRHADQPKAILIQLVKKLFFPDVDLHTLPKRMLDQDSNADADMKLLLKQLKKHPVMPVPIYAVAISSIQASIDNGRHEQGQQYLNQLREIEPLITVKAIYEQVHKAIELIKLPNQIN